MALKKKYGTDASKIKQGVPYIIDEYEKDGEVVQATVTLSFMSAASNKAFEKEITRLSKPYRRQLASGNMDVELNRRITIKAFVKTIVKGWDNVVVEEGQDPLPYTPENVEAVMVELPELYDDMLQFASDRSNFGIGEEDPEGAKDAAGNSPNGSGSSSNFPTKAETKNPSPPSS